MTTSILHPLTSELLSGEVQYMKAENELCSGQVEHAEAQQFAHCSILIGFAAGVQWYASNEQHCLDRAGTLLSFSSYIFDIQWS